jgi:hypothetical protein
MYLGAGLGVALTGFALAWLMGLFSPAGRPARGRNPWLGARGAVLVLTGVTLLYFWPVLLAERVFPKGGGDLWGQLYPVWSFVAHQLRGGVFPLWDPLLMAGDPILSEAQYGLFNPLNWPIFMFSPPPAALILWRGMVTLLLAGVGTYLFLTWAPKLRLSPPAGLLGAVAYMLADPFVVHLGHPQINDALAWLPWSLLGIDWALTARRRRKAALAGIPVALMLLAGHGQIALYGLITLGLYGAWETVTLPSGNAARPFDRAVLPERLGRLALAALVGFALAAPMLLPAMERMPWTTRSLVPDDQRRGYEFAPALLADTLAPYIHGRGPDGWWPALDRVETAYAGAITLFFALLGIVTRPRRSLFWVVLGLLAFLFALGYQAPFYPAVAGLPFFTDLWKTARAIYLTSFALAVLGALGVQAVIDGLHQKQVSLWVWLLVAGGVILAIAAPYFLGGVPEGQPTQRALDNLRLVAVLALGVAFLVWCWRRWRMRWALAGILLLSVAELVALGALAESDPATPLAASAAGSEHAAALAFLRGDTGWFRVDSHGAARHLWSPETLQVQGFETLQGSGNPLSLWPFEQFYWTQPNKSAPGYRLLGAKYIIMPKGDPAPGENIWPVFTEDPAVDVLLNTPALPRAWLVYRTEPVDSYGAAWEKIQDPDFRPEQVATIEYGPRLEGTGSGRIEIVRYSPNQVRLIVHTDMAALLVLSDVYYPGWRGTIDGEATPIYRADATFRGVVVPAGSHEVRMDFAPRSFRIGLGLAAGGLLILLLALVPDRTLRKFSSSRFRFVKTDALVYDVR